MKQIITIRGELVSRLGAILAGPKLFILRYVDAISCPNRTRTATETDAAHSVQRFWSSLVRPSLIVQLAPN